jgi:hypothetical protein
MAARCAVRVVARYQFDLGLEARAVAAHGEHLEPCTPASEHLGVRPFEFTYAVGRDRVAPRHTLQIRGRVAEDRGVGLVDARVPTVGPDHRDPLAGVREQAVPLGLPTGRSRCLDREGERGRRTVAGVHDRSADQSVHRRSAGREQALAKLRVSHGAGPHQAQHRDQPVTVARVRHRQRPDLRQLIFVSAEHARQRLVHAHETTVHADHAHRDRGVEPGRVRAVASHRCSIRAVPRLRYRPGGPNCLRTTSSDRRRPTGRA